MKMWILLAVLLPALAYGAPHIISDPSTRTDITHCGIYRGSDPRVLSPAAKDATGRPYCRHDIASWSPGTYSVTATFVIAGTPEQESAKSAPLQVVVAPALTAPSGLRVSEVALGGGELVAQVLDVPPKQVVQLTVPDSIDWRAWGHSADSAVNAKAGGQTQVSPPRHLGGGISHLWTSLPNQRRLSWADGTPTPRAVESLGYIDNGPPAQAAPGQGWEWDVPADTATRTVTLYVGGYKTMGRIEAVLSDGSAPAYSQTIGLDTGSWERDIRITYRSKSAGKLTLRWTQVDPGGVDGGNIRVAAIRLDAGVAP